LHPAGVVPPFFPPDRESENDRWPRETGNEAESRGKPNRLARLTPPRLISSIAGKFFRVASARIPPGEKERERERKRERKSEATK